MSDAYRQTLRDMDRAGRWRSRPINASTWRGERAARRVRRLTSRWMRFLRGLLKSTHVDP